MIILNKILINYNIKKLYIQKICKNIYMNIKKSVIKILMYTKGYKFKKVK